VEEMSTSFALAFLLPFHIGGGAAVGVALRRMVHGGFSFSGCTSNAFLVVWGVMFGGIPLFIGSALESTWVLALQIVAFLGTIVLVAVFYQWLRDLYRQPGMFVSSFGFVFFVVGAAVTSFILTSGDPEGFWIGLIFAGVGGLLTLAGVLLLLRST